MNDKKFNVWEGKDKNKLKADVNLDHNMIDKIKHIDFEQSFELTSPEVYSFLGKVFIYVL